MNVFAPYLHISPESALCHQFPAGGHAGRSLGNWPALQQEEAHRLKTVISFHSTAKKYINIHTNKKQRTKR